MEPISPRDPDWPALLARLPAHSPFVRPEWCYLLQRYLDGYSAASLRLRSGSTFWILPGLLLRKPLSLRSFQSLPFGTHGGLLGDEPPPPPLLADLLSHLKHAVGPWITITPDPLAPQPPPPGFRARYTTTHVLDLSAGYRVLWDRSFSRNLRNQVRKAEKLEILVRPTTGREILADFQLLWRQMQDRRRLALPFTTTFWGALFTQPWCKLYAARLAEQTLAVAVVLLGKKQAHWWQGVVDRSAGPLNPNRLLVARVIEDLCGLGIERFDLGGSEGQPGLAQFKEAFGALETPVVHWRHTPAWAIWSSAPWSHGAPSPQPSPPGRGGESGTKPPHPTPESGGKPPHSN
ncbi:GNAT family N-acetyltransferase [bacterium]|nr:GNAT family N-acetyltransferase [bacterium]